MPPFVTIASYLYPTDAHLARARLEACGIVCVLANEYLAGMNWTVTSALHGIQAQVPEADAARATAILRDDGDHSLESWVAFEQEQEAGRESSSSMRVENENGQNSRQSPAGSILPGGERSAVTAGRRTGAAEEAARPGEYLSGFLAETAEGVCPRCRSSNSAPRNLGRILRVLLVFLLFFAPLPDRRRRFLCRDCGHLW